MNPRLFPRQRLSFAELVEKELPTFSVDTSVEHAGTRPGAAGATFETIIAVTNKAYERLGWGIVKKNQLRTMVKNGRLVRTQKSTVDYDGFLLDVGFVAFDCKSCEDDVWRPSRDQLHQFLYLLSGQRTMPRKQARFFYIIEFRRPDDKHGSLRVISRAYLVESLEEIALNGKYEPRACDEIKSAKGGILFDYREKLILSFSA